MHDQELNQAWAELTAPGAPLEIETIEVRSVNVRSYSNAPASVREVWLSTLKFAERDYIVYEDERLTYAQAHAQVAAIANWLRRQGVGPGDRIAIAMRNYPEWILIYWACLSTGVVVVGMNAWWVTDELEYALKDSAPKVVFCDRERLERIRAREGMAAGLPLVVVRLDPPSDETPWAAVIGEGGALPVVEVAADADACIFYTSGTTGKPKGAQLTHRGCVTNLFNIMFIAQAQALAAARGTGVALDPSIPPPIPAMILATPLFHVTANNCGAYPVTAAGGKMALMYRWDAERALEIIEREKITAISGVPVMARELLSHPDFHRYDTSSLLMLGGGGAPLQPDLVDKIETGLKNTRPNTGYGMTETTGIITSVSGDFFVHRPGSVGRIMPTYEARCVDDEGRTVGPGEVGELWVKGATVIKGYINRPEATAESITDGWLHTGDVARIDEQGFVFIVDRKKDMVLRGGENVYCAEVEACVHHHPAVAECCVFGVPDARLGEEVAAAVVLRPGFELSAEALRAHCAVRLAKHKIPRYVWFLTQPIPRNANGKFLKRELRDVLSLETAR
jgi:long-chain acyl-CoA synthetase